MKSFITIISVLFAFTFVQNTQAQCGAGESEIIIDIVPDDYPAEISWELTDIAGNELASGGATGETVCVAANTCLQFTIFDSYGDGICCGEGQGSYTVTVDGVVVATGGDYDDEELTEINCPAGSTCNSAESVEASTTSIDANWDNHWYSFTPSQNGSYLIDACDNSCDAAIWVYGVCAGLQWDDTPAGSSFYTDGGCAGTGAELYADFEANITYYIRIGDLADDCAGGSIAWTVSYAGPISGCTDPLSCTYNPLAEQSDPDACFYFPDAECTQGADSIIIGGTTLYEREVAIDLEVPWEVLWGPDDYLWVTERPGRVLRINPISGNQSVVLDLSDNVYSGGEPGMLGMVMHPDFETTPKVYLVYNFLLGGSNLKEKLVGYDWNGTALVNEVELLQVDAGGIHNGSRLLITPDYKILMTTGDTGSDFLAQDMSSLSGKILRINLDGTVPDDNPTSGSYVYSYGHRNPQGLAFGPNGLIYSSEHGPSTGDELNIIEAGRNYGWPNVVGECNTAAENTFCAANNVREPLTEWSPCPAVSDIVYYNHPAIPEFENSVLMTVLGGLGGGWERVSQLQMNADGTQVVGENQYFDNFGRLRDICVNPYTGAIYFATNGDSYPGSGPNRIIEYRNYAYQVEPPVSDEITESLDKQFIRIYPNPVKGQGQIVFSDSFIGHKYELISYAGQTVVSDKIRSNRVLLNTSELPAGHYFVKAVNDLGTITKAVLITD